MNKYNFSLLVFFPGESQGRGSLGGCRLWGSRESDPTEATQQQQQQQQEQQQQQSSSSIAVRGLPWWLRG